MAKQPWTWPKPKRWPNSSPQRLARLKRGPDERLLIEEALDWGERRAAVVVQQHPLRIAAYSRPFDAVVLLHFTLPEVISQHLRLGSRLLSVNLYRRKPGADPDPDLSAGPRAKRPTDNFVPYIADFLTGDTKRLALRKAEISEAEWQHTAALGRAYLAKHPDLARDGRPTRCGIPARSFTAV